MEYKYEVLEGRTERQIPKVRFIEDVPAFMAKSGGETKDVIEVLQEVHNELARINTKLLKLKDQIKEAIPELKDNLEVIAMARRKQNDDPIQTTFQLSASIFAEAELDQQKGMVVMWLGANTAAELTYDEAEDMLKKNLASKEELLATTEEDLKFVKKQTTVTEVSIARVYNNDVKEKRKERDQES